MAWADLSAEEKAVVTDFVRLARAWAGEQARTSNHSDALNTAYNATVTTLLGEIGESELIPDGSGLGGAVTLTRAEVVTLVSHMQGILTDYNTSGHRQLWSKAAGPGNLIG